MPKQRVRVAGPEAAGLLITAVLACALTVLPAAAEKPDGAASAGERPAAAEFRDDLAAVARCRRAAKVFKEIPGRDLADTGPAVSTVRAGIERLTTRSYESFERRNPERPVIFLEGATSSVHFHDVRVLADPEPRTSGPRVIAVWSLAYGRGAHSSERVLSLIEYERAGSAWKVSAAGINLATYVGPETVAPRVVRHDRERYAVVVPEDGAGEGGRVVLVHFIPRGGCFMRAPHAGGP